MHFFKLSSPAYRSDREANRRNPVVSHATHFIPGIACSRCGRWASSHRLPVPLPESAVEFEGPSFLSVDEWLAGRQRWAAQLQVDPSLIHPGARLGLPSGTCSAEIREDVVHPMPGEVWVAHRVRDAIVEAGATGVSFLDVQLPANCHAQGLSTILVHGRAWRRGSTEESLRQCEICGRTGFPSPKVLTVDEARWDGSDFITLDGNPNIIVIVSGVRDLLESHAFSNVIAIPIMG